MVKKILLIGFRATGKTTVGRLLAERLSWEFVDLDTYIEKKLGKSIREVVEESGWEAFREAERRAMREFIGKEKLVLSLGGGAVMHAAEMEALKEDSFTVWLDASAEVVLERLSRDPRTATQRPALTEKSFEEEVREVLETRRPLYARFADLRISSDALSPEEVTQRMVEYLSNSSRASEEREQRGPEREGY